MSRLTDLLADMAVDAQRAMQDIAHEEGATSDELLAAAFKAMFHLGVAVGLSDVGPLALADLAAINTEPMDEGVDEVRAVLRSEGPVH